ncbi:MAG: hypothetical protein WD055_03340 [Candidatus Dependentiae bacterium]
MNKSYQYVYLLSCLIAQSIIATEVSVKNTIDKPLFLSFYYQNKETGQALQTGAVVSIDAHAKIVIQKPVAQSEANRYLLVSNTKQFPFKLSKNTFESFAKVYVGKWRSPLKRQKFYISTKDLKIKLYTASEWEIVQENLIKGRLAVEKLKGSLRNQLGAIRDNPNNNRIAQLRIGNSLHQEERDYLGKRAPKVKQAVEKLVAQNLDNKKIPNITFVASGGGDRAMLLTTNYLLGAQEIGLLDATTYISSLSGSTWALGFWMASGKDIKTFKENLMRKIPRGLHKINPNEMRYMADAWATKFVYNQPVTLVDFYGGLLANAYLSDFERRHRVYLSQQVDRIKNGDVPLPIYTAINASEFQKMPEWYEFTPYEVGGAWLGAYVPTWAYGRAFNNGVSVDFAPEQSLGYLAGTFGSAFAFSFADVYQHMPDELQGNLKMVTNYLLKKAISSSDYVVKKIPSAVLSQELKLAKESGQTKQLVEMESKRLAQQGLKNFGDLRVSVARINNFVYNVPGLATKNLAQVKLADGGLAFNLPYPPISGERPERKADIIVFLDASGGIIGDELKGAENYARAKGLKFPKIDYTNIGKKAISIFKDEKDKEVPVVIYLPKVKDEVLLEQYKGKADLAWLVDYLKDFDAECAGFLSGDCATLKFQYSEFQARQLGALAEFNIRASKDKIVDTIRWWIDKHN